LRCSLARFGMTTWYLLEIVVCMIFSFFPIDDNNVKFIWPDVKGKKDDFTESLIAQLAKQKQV